MVRCLTKRQAGRYRNTAVLQHIQRLRTGRYTNTVHPQRLEAGRYTNTAYPMRQRTGRFTSAVHHQPLNQVALTRIVRLCGVVLVG